MHLLQIPAGLPVPADLQAVRNISLSLPPKLQNDPVLFEAALFVQYAPDTFSALFPVLLPAFPLSAPAFQSSGFFPSVPGFYGFLLPALPPSFAVPDSFSALLPLSRLPAGAVLSALPAIAEKTPVPASAYISVVSFLTLTCFLPALFLSVQAASEILFLSPSVPVTAPVLPQLFHQTRTFSSLPVSL